MADRKNQHFVPRVHFKPWTHNGEGKSINLFNVGTDRCIKNAPLKGQCSRDYFYGEDLQIERWLGIGEGMYAELVRQLQRLDNPEIERTLRDLQKFALLQSLRTEQSVAEDASVLKDMHQSIFLDEVLEAYPKPTHEDSIRVAFQKWYDSHEHIEDLKCVLIRNNSSMPFITSDDPCIHTNKLHLQKIKSDNFGIGNSGCIITMPISPNLAILYYDGDVYSLPDKKLYVITISKTSDVSALNQLQLIRCNRNVYFHNWYDADEIRRQFKLVSGRRILVHHRITALVEDKEFPDRYRPATDAELKKEGKHLIHVQGKSFYPLNWPGFLHYRDGKHGYSNGSAAGYMRWGEAEKRGFKRGHKVRL